MARVPYNGFTVSDRAVSSHYFRWALKQGRWPRPQKNRCDACLQPSGQIEWHREDYSIIDPSGLVTLCYRCHRVLHLREKNPEAWDAYRDAVRAGWRWTATRSFGVVIAQNIAGRIAQGVAQRVNEVRGRTVLDDVHEGLLLLDTPEVRRVRMDALREEWNAVKAASAPVEAADAKLF